MTSLPPAVLPAPFLHKNLDITRALTYYSKRLILSMNRK
jgi:hypothetical protein